MTITAGGRGAAAVPGALDDAAAGYRRAKPSAAAATSLPAMPTPIASAGHTQASIIGD